MPFRIGPLELILILVIVLLIFGAGRLPEIGSALGKSIRAFRSSASGADEEKKPKEQTPGQTPPSQNKQ
ncbi:MAG: twin-arginine translocase TatA/TatE family subunit [Chloroflexi bacterium]|nr:twin-arginine translocase TatA/TatE family subunit [Chloroflexota bacterium]